MNGALLCCGKQLATPLGNFLGGFLVTLRVFLVLVVVVEKTTGGEDPRLSSGNIAISSISRFRLFSRGPRAGS